MKKMKNKRGIDNNLISEAIKRSLVEDMNKAYMNFKDSIDLKGIILKVNINNGYGRYLYSDLEKIQDLTKYLAKNLAFPTKIIFAKDGDEELYPMIEE